MKKSTLIALGLAALGLGAAAIPVGGGVARATPGAPRPTPLDLSAYSAAAPGKPIDVLFIHHSCGGQMLGNAGPEVEKANCVYESHPNGGGLRALLAQAGYRLHEASYGSEIGEKTDLFDWLPKFRDKMDKVLRVDLNDVLLPEGQKNQVVVFKSCYPNNRFVGAGQGEGSPEGPELTVANAKATLRALLPLFAKQRDTLFVYVTPPALAGKALAEPALKVLLRKAMGKPSALEVFEKQGALARELNTWVVSRDGWLKDYPERNVVVFDYYDRLTNEGQSNHSQYATGDGTDNHPSKAGNAKAANDFVPFLNQAVRRAGLVTSDAASDGGKTGAL